MPPSYPEYQDIKLSFQSNRQLAIVHLNRPVRRNAWTYRMSQDLADCYEKLDTDEEVRVVIMTGTGPAFCFGAELVDGGGKNPFAGEATSDLISHRDTGGVAALAIWKCKKVTIAAVNGPAVGIGATILLPQDLRITYANNKVGFVFGARGIITEAASSFFLPKLVGMTSCLALLTTAQVLPASHDWLKPLWSVVLDKPDQVLPHAIAMSEDIIKRCSGVSHAVNKTLVWNAKSNPEEHHFLDSIGIYLIGERDGKEGIQSFLEKRDPKFTDSYQDPTIQGYLRLIKARL